MVHIRHGERLRRKRYILQDSSRPAHPPRPKKHPQRARPSAGSPRPHSPASARPPISTASPAADLQGSRQSNRSPLPPGTRARCGLRIQQQRIGPGGGPFRQRHIGSACTPAAFQTSTPKRERMAARRSGGFRRPAPAPRSAGRRESPLPADRRRDSQTPPRGGYAARAASAAACSGETKRGEGGKRRIPRHPRPPKAQKPPIPRGNPADFHLFAHFTAWREWPPPRAPGRQRR